MRLPGCRVPSKSAVRLWGAATVTISPVPIPSLLHPLFVRRCWRPASILVDTGQGGGGCSAMTGITNGSKLAAKPIDALKLKAIPTP